MKSLQQASAAQALPKKQRAAPASLLVIGTGSAGSRHLTNARALGVTNLCWNNADGFAILETSHRRYSAPLPEPFDRNDLFRAEMTHFLSCIEERAEPPCILADGERALRVCLAAKESALSGRRIDV